LTDIRAPNFDDLEGFVKAMSGPFGFDLPESEDETGELLSQLAKVWEPERALITFDKDRIVGTLGTFSFDMTVPGGSLPVAGTTMVTVQVTHRRQGVLSAMMRAHLEEAVAHGDAAAALWASDSAIYGRFGYGMAAWTTEIEIDRTHVAFHRLAVEPARVELVDVDEVREPTAGIYDKLRREIPGMVAHSEGWWDRIFRDQPHHRRGATKARHGLVVEAGTPTGWVRYRLKDTEGHGHPAQDVIVSQMYATTPSAWSGLWTHVLSHDFGRTIRADLRPVDDPIHFLLRGIRRARTSVSDGLWFRILDVKKTLEGRSFGGEGRLGLDVRDPLGIAAGRYSLEVDGSGATVDTTDATEIEIDIEDLSALALGGRSALQLAMAGRIRGSDDAVERLDRMFRGSRAPWSPVIF
jgi:predicted acetyltransferase